LDVYLFYLTASGRPEPEYTLRRVMSSEPIHDEQYSTLRQLTWFPAIPATQSRYSIMQSRWRHTTRNWN